jgi:hypothetical protein
MALGAGIDPDLQYTLLSHAVAETGKEAGEDSPPMTQIVSLAGVFELP